MVKLQVESLSPSMAQPTQLGLQDAASPVIEELLYFHDHTLITAFFISMMVIYIILITLTSKVSYTSTTDAQEIEIVWTVIPAIVLVAVALPSLRLLYLTDEITSPNISIKTVGHQWYWTYEYSDFDGVIFDSYIIPPKDITPGQFRLLEVDNRAVLPSNTLTRNLITADDVLHSWAIPALGVKSDAIPGRLNQISLHPNPTGVYFGQCSEICGANHSFMPIVLEVLPIDKFLTWLNGFE